MVWQDLRYAARTLVRTPAFRAVAVLSLALGMGANTAPFSLMDVMLLRALPVRIRSRSWSSSERTPMAAREPRHGGPVRRRRPGWFPSRAAGSIHCTDAGAAQRVRFLSARRHL